MTQSTEQVRALANLRHIYAQMVQGAVKDSAQAKRIAEGLLSPAIAGLEQAARRAPAVPQGWRLVPVEPTPAMVQAGRDEPLAGESDEDAPEDYKSVYRAMLAAAPQPPEATVKESLQVDCACGDSYQADSFGAGFIAARGKCPNCDAAEAAPVQLPVLTDEQVKEIRRRAYRENGQGGCWYDVTAAIHDTEHQVRELLSHGK